PVGEKIDNSHVPAGQVFADVDLAAVTDHFDFLATAGNKSSAFHKDERKLFRPFVRSNGEAPVAKGNRRSLLQTIRPGVELRSSTRVVEQDLAHVSRRIAGNLSIR